MEAKELLKVAFESLLQDACYADELVSEKAQKEVNKLSKNEVERWLMSVASGEAFLQYSLEDYAFYLISHKMEVQNA